MDFGSDRIGWSSAAQKIFAYRILMLALLILQMDVCLHSLNAVFLLGEVLLNCMVIFHCVLFVCSCHFSLLTYLLNTCRDFQCFDLHILFCGRLCLCFSSGSSMLVFHYGKNEYPIFWLLLFTGQNSHNFLSVFPGGLILSLTCHPHMQPYGMFLNSVHHHNSNRICKMKI